MIGYRLQVIEKKTKIIFFVVLLFLLFTIYYSLFTSSVIAQEISLSVSPPLTELTIMPGKGAKQIYTITNNGLGTIISPQLVFFNPEDKFGNVSLTNNPAPEWIKYNPTAFSLKPKESVDFYLNFNPPADTAEDDYFLSLVFESREAANITNENSSLVKTKIISNILLSISKDDTKPFLAQISRFEGPRIVDSLFQHLYYNVELKNNGSSFWKPIGKISNKYESFKLAPLNILKNTDRKIYCIEDENLVECKSKYFFPLGKIISTLEFKLDNQDKIYKQEIVTYAFPFSLLFGIGLLLTLIKFKPIFKLWPKRRY